MKKLVVGESVNWTDEFGKLKKGVIVQVIPALKVPDVSAFKQTHSLRAVNGFMRSQESYLIQVEPKVTAVKPSLHWPRVSDLQLAEVE